MTAPRHNSKIKFPDTSSAGLLHSGFFGINQLQKVSKNDTCINSQNKKNKATMK
jgi:hypothetical protein